MRAYRASRFSKWHKICCCISGEISSKALSFAMLVKSRFRAHRSTPDAMFGRNGGNVAATNVGKRSEGFVSEERVA